MGVTRPGRRARGTRTGRPLLVALDLLGRRWALRVLWELRLGPSSFRALCERCDAISPSVLNARLKELREARIVELGDEGYTLSAQGRKLIAALEPLDRWADGWGKEFPR